MTIELLKHQSALINAVRLYDKIPYIFLIGGFACLTGKSKLKTPQGEVSLYKFEGGEILTPEGFKTVAQPIPRWMKTVDVSVDDLQIRCSDAHQFLSADGRWISCRELLERLLARTFLHILQSTSTGCDQSVPPSDVLRLMRKAQDYLVSYLSYYRFGDEQLRLLEEGDRGEIPLLEYAREQIRSHHVTCPGPLDGEIVRVCIHLYPLVHRLSIVRSTNPHNNRELKEPLLIETDESYRTLSVDFARYVLQSQCLIGHQQSAEITQDSIFQILASKDLLTTDIISENGNKSTVNDLTFAGIDKCYHLTVPDMGCYYADGLLHHNCGKSFTDVSLMFFLYEQYRSIGATFGLVGASIKLLSQTVLKDFEQFCTSANVVYKDNSQKGFIQVGNVRFVYLSGADPGDIYAHNFNGIICDELDELPPDRIMALMKAMQERARVKMPKTKLINERPPFIAFTTTAQGLGGTYQLIQYLKKVGLPHMVIRARTADNPHIDPIMIENLSKLYTPEEREAFLEGKFVNLAAGRVYPMFDRKKHVYMPFSIVAAVACDASEATHRVKDVFYNGGDTIYVGADFNYGFDNICSIIERSGHIYVVMEHQAKFMGDAPRVLREAFPFNKIEFVPDASGKEVMQGLVEEFAEADVSVFWNNVNPGIGERVTAVNRLLAQNRLHVFSNCERIALGLEIQDYDDNGKPRKGKGPEAVDHILDCLSYAVWRVIHQVKGYDDILEAIRAVHHHKELLNPSSEGIIEPFFGRNQGGSINV